MQLADCPPADLSDLAQEIWKLRADLACALAFYFFAAMRSAVRFLGL